MVNATMPSSTEPSHPASFSWTSLFRDLVTDRLFLVLSAAFMVVELGNASVLPLLTSREKAIELSAEADNADLLKKSDAAKAEQKALTAEAEADNAPKKEAALARRAKALALLTEAEATIAAANAENSPLKMKAAADAQSALADLTAQKVAVETENARQAQRKLRAELELSQISIAISKITTMAGQLKINLCPDCDPTYCIMCTDKHDVPDLPSGATLPPLNGEAEKPAPQPVIRDLVRVFPWQDGSPNSRTYDTWRATLPFGALATGGYHHSNIGFCSGKPDLESARKCALRDCGYDDCQVLSEMTDAAAVTPAKPSGPETKPALTRIHKALFPLGGGCRDLFDEWKVGQAFGAFAVSSEHCGSSHDEPDLETAKRDALHSCGQDNCYLVYQIAKADPPISGAHGFATVVPEQLNVHAGPNKESAVVGQIVEGEKIEITSQAEGDYVAIKATCRDGKSCDGYINGRSEFINRLP